MSETDDEWVMIDHSSNVAMGEAWQWAGTARAQVARVIDPPGSDLMQIPDAYQAVAAIRKVRRAVEMAVEYLTDPAAKEQLGEVMAAFDRAHPHVRDARDVLEHFDEYTRGVGRLQQRKVKQPEPNEELARSFRARLEFVDGDRRRPRLQVGPYPVDLAEAADAASLLPYEIWEAIEIDRGDPVPRGWAAAVVQQPVEPRVIAPPPWWFLDVAVDPMDLAGTVGV